MMFVCATCMVSATSFQEYPLLTDQMAFDRFFEVFLWKIGLLCIHKIIASFSFFCHFFRTRREKNYEFIKLHKGIGQKLTYGHLDD